MSQDKRIRLPAGLPKRFVAPEQGFAQLRSFLEIQNTKQLEALLANEVVKHSVQHVSVARLRGADRRRVLLTAFYEAPDSRRKLWRQALDRPPDASDISMRPLPSLEFIALQGYDAEFREREVVADAVEDALRDLPDVVESVADAPDWQHPALAVWPVLHRDITDWNALPDDRRKAAVPALFAIATVLDDLRFLRWAARGVDALLDEFSMLLNDQPEDAPPDGGDIIRHWKELCDTIATTARTLGVDPLRPELLPELSRHVDALTHLREPLTKLLNDAVPEKLLQRVDDILARLAEDGDSPITEWTDQIGAQWRSVYSPGDAPAVEFLRADVERLEGELESALNEWRAKRHKEVELNARHQEAKRRSETAHAALERLDADDRATELQHELGRAAEEIQSARNRVFLVAAPGNETFDPRRNYMGERDPLTPDPPADPTDEVRDPPTDTDPSPAQSTVKDDAASTARAEPTVPPTEVDRRWTPAAEGMWRALRDNRPGIAFHIARLCAAQGYAATPPALADVIAASMVAIHVQSPDSDSARDLRPILERIDPAALLRDERRQPERDAVNLLLFSAALRPALFLPSTGAPSLLRGVSLSESLSPIYRLATTVADHADRLQGVRLHASLFRPSHVGTWQERFDVLAGRVRAWHASADSKHNIYGPATKLWRDLLARGPLAKLVKLISAPDRSARSDVEAIHKRISDQRTFNHLVHRADEKGRRRNPIQGRALKQMWTDVQPAVDLSSQWLSLMDTRPDTAGFISQRMDTLHNNVERDGRSAIDALQAAANLPSVAPPLAAALTRARTTVDDLLGLFNRTAPITESTLSANVIRSRDLLYVTDLELDTSFNPVSREATHVLDRLLNTAEHEDTMRDAFDARLERGEFIGARLALDCLESDEDDVDVGECAASFTLRIDDRRKALRSDLRNTQRSIESAFCRGLLPADDRDGMAAELTALRQVAERSALTPPRLDEVEILTGSSRRIREIGDRIAASSRMSKAQARDRLANVPAGRMDEAAKETVEWTISQEDVQTAHEQINCLERGESVTPPPPPEDPFAKFTRDVEAIEAARKTTNVGAIVRGAERREHVSGVRFDRLSDDEAHSAAGLLDAWYRMARKRSVDETLLRDFLQGLGFSVRTITPQRSGSLATVTSELIADRAVCPSRQFGSETNGRYRVLLIEPRSAVDSIFTSIGTEGGDPAIVLHFGCLGADRDEIRKRATREHRLFLVVDETLVLFLAGLATKRLSALFRCTLPHSAALPYATTSGLVPPELFYGRDSERQAIRDQSGACFVYGGRQLGKTALLRRVEHDFNRSLNHVAKWIDLKVNEIDRAPDLWRVLQRELQRSEVIAGRRELDPDSRKQVDGLLDHIRRWLDARAGRRLLLLLDEADHFLLVDANNDFRESARLKGLMDETNRRFKVVFAGLHNVLRTTRQANHPLAHLGDPICVGAMLSNGEWKQAQALVREPLQAVGCRFGRDDLSTRILAHTNYYPSLIQLYGAELMRRVRDSEKAFPYEIDDDDIDKAYGSRELRSAIRERFLLTLQLDQRYEVIAYAIACELTEAAGLDRGLERDQILEAAKSWWPEGFEVRDLESDMLLQEMVGLGVLREIEPSRYTLRNPNILLLLGNREDIEKALTREREPKTVYAPASFRARYPQEPYPSARRGPLTRQQESQLRNGGVAVICGCPAAGLEDVPEFLSQRIERDEFSRVQPAGTTVEFDQQLRKLPSVRNSVTVRLVPPTLDWDMAWVRTAKHVVQGKAQGKRAWNRVAFIATPQGLWRLLTQATADPDLDGWRTDEPEGLWRRLTAATESALNGVDLFPLGPCDLTFLKRWLDDINATADGGATRDFLRVSGGWPVELDRFGRKKSNRSWKTRIEELEREVARGPVKRLRDEFGLADQAATVFRGLLGADPIDDESIELVSSVHDLDRQLVRRRILWGALLGLLSPTEDGSWIFNPLVKRLLEAAPAR